MLYRGFAEANLRRRDAEEELLLLFDLSGEAEFNRADLFVCEDLMLEGFDSFVRVLRFVADEDPLPGWFRVLRSVRRLELRSGLSEPDR